MSVAPWQRRRAAATLIAFSLFVSLAQLGFAGHRGVINDPDGYVNVRSDKHLDASVVARVKSGETFSFECEPREEWARVTLASGKTGWMHHSRIRLHFTGRDLRGKTDPNHELHYISRKLGIDYYALARRAASGDVKALKKYFGITGTDGAGAELHFSALPEVFHLVGDDKFADFLRAQPLAYQLDVRASLANGHLATYPFEAVGYLRRHFPKTAELLLRGEVVDWPSPDGRYAIRKVFSDHDDLESSKVARAELIEHATGKVLCNMTADDIGTGAEREGNVLWSSDSKRFAYLSSNLTRPPGNLFSTPPPPPQKKQTTVYQRSGESFAKVEVPLHELPGRAGDAEIKDAVRGHEFIEPMRWAKPNVLVLERHEYFEKLQPTAIGKVKFESIHSFDRLYEITVTIQPNNTATAEVKRGARND